MDTLFVAANDVGLVLTDWLGVVIGAVSAFAAVAAWRVASKVSRYAKSNQDLYELEREKFAGSRTRIASQLLRMSRHLDGISGALKVSMENDPQITGLGVSAVQEVISDVELRRAEIVALLDAAVIYKMQVSVHLDVAQFLLFNATIRGRPVVQRSADQRSYAERASVVQQSVEGASVQIRRAYDALPKDVRDWATGLRPYDEVFEEEVASYEHLF